MAKYEVVFDVGSQYISAGLVKDGFTVTMPSVVAVEMLDNKEVLGVGVAAVNLATTNAAKVKMVYPILEGAVIDPYCAKMLFEELLSRVTPNRVHSYSQVSATVIVPCGMINSDKKALENILLSLGVKEVSFVETALADSIELFKEFRTNRGIIVDIGSDCCDLAVVFADNIVAGCTLYYSGKGLTQLLAERIRKKYLIQIDNEQAEQFKLNCVSLYSNDTTCFTVKGINLQTGNTETINVSSKEVYDGVVEYAKRYIKVIDSLLNAIPEQVSTLVKQEGVFLCGGGAKLNGLDSFMHNELEMPVRVSSDPRNVCINVGILYCQNAD